MRRVLVPLDGTPFSTSFLPDALRLASPEGELILVHDSPEGDSDDTDRDTPYEASEAYLAGIARDLREDGASVATRTFVMDRPGDGVTEAWDR